MELEAGDAATRSLESGWSSLWWPFVMSLVSGLSTVLGAVLVLLRARLTSAPLSSSHLAFTAGLACSVMVVVSIVQMLLPASFTSPHCIGPLAALSICAVSATVCLVAIRQAPIDRLLALMGLSTAALLQSGGGASLPFTPPLTPLHSLSGSSGAITPVSRPASPSRSSSALSSEKQSGAYDFSLPSFLQRYVVGSGDSGSRAEHTAADGDDCGEVSSSNSSGSGGGSGVSDSSGIVNGSRDDVRLMIGSGVTKTSARSHYVSYPSPPSLRSSVAPPSSLSTLRLGVLTAVILAMHNLPEGLAVFVSSFDDRQAGISMAIALSAHNIPEVSKQTCSGAHAPHMAELLVVPLIAPLIAVCVVLCCAALCCLLRFEQGLIIATPIYASTRSVWQTVCWTAASGVTEPLGALLALTVLRPYLTHRLMQQLLCCVSGIMLTVAAFELFPAGRAYKQPKAMQAGLVTGVIVICLTSAVSAAIW